MMKMSLHQLRRWAAGLTMMSLPLIGVALAPASLADDCMFNPGSLDCLMNSDDGFSGGDMGGGTQPGDLVIPADGGSPAVAVAPAPAGAPVVTTDGVVIPAG